MDHLPLHCPIAVELWAFIFADFGGKWVIPKLVQGILQCWGWRLSSFRKRTWNIVPSCL